MILAAGRYSKVFASGAISILGVSVEGRRGVGEGCICCWVWILVESCVASLCSPKPLWRLSNLEFVFLSSVRGVGLEVL